MGMGSVAMSLCRFWSRFCMILFNRVQHTFFIYLCQNLLSFIFFTVTILTYRGRYLIVVLTHISLIIVLNSFSCIFCLFTCLLGPLSIFKIGLFVFFFFFAIELSGLYIFYINHMWDDVWFAMIFFQSMCYCLGVVWVSLKDSVWSESWLGVDGTFGRWGWGDPWTLVGVPSGMITEPVFPSLWLCLSKLAFCCTGSSTHDSPTTLWLHPRCPFPQLNEWGSVP